MNLSWNKTGTDPFTGAGGEIVIRLEGPTRHRWRPRHDGLVAGISDGQRRCADGLHDGNQTPKAAGQRIIAAAHRVARIMLANGAADLISAARARAAATVNGEPINGVRLGKRTRRQQQAVDAEHTHYKDSFHERYYVGLGFSYLSKLRRYRH